MAKVVQVVLKEGEEWREIEVPNFYDPEKHHTVRFGADDKRSYAAMKMPNGQIYDKLKGAWIPDEVKIDVPTHVIDFDYDEVDLSLYGDGTVKIIRANDVLHEVPDLVAFMDECYRVLGAKGELQVVVPYGLKAFDSPRAVRCFTLNTFRAFDKLFKRIQRVENDTICVRFVR